MAIAKAKTRKKTNAEVPAAPVEQTLPPTEEQLAQHRTTDAFCDWIRSFDKHGYSLEGGPRSPFVDAKAAEHFIGQIRKYIHFGGYVGQLSSGFVQQASQEGSGQQTS